MVGASVFDAATTARRMASVLPRGVHWIKSAVAAFEPERDAVTLDGCQVVMQWQQPDEWRLDDQLKRWAATQPLACKAVDSEHFLSARDDMATLMRGRRQWLTEHFYRHMRRSRRLPLEADGGPEGGQWKFDHDNRKPWPGTLKPDDGRAHYTTIAHRRPCLNAGES